jgi:DNA-binding transcriptional LysR family regulator
LYCYRRRAVLEKKATEGLEKANRKWEIVFTGTSIANIQAAVQAGMGLPILPMDALKEGLRKAPSHLGLPELPMYSIVLVTDEQKVNDAGDVFIDYLEAELNKLNPTVA